MSQQKYTEEFKQEAVRLTCQPGKSVRIVAAELGVSRASLDHWRKIHQARARQPRRGTDRANGRTSAVSDGQIVVDAEEYRQLKRELELARQERDILKKAVAYFAQPPK